MRFTALLRKELRESLPWILLACILLLAVGFLIIRLQAISGIETWRYNSIKPGEVVDSYLLFTPSAINDSGTWLICIAPCLGIILAIRHFAIPFFTKTWPFLLHRSAHKITILSAKIAAAAIAIVACLGFAWGLLYWYASQPGLFIIPPPLRLLTDGLLYTVLGLMIYLGAALSALSPNRWYTTKVFGLVLPTIIILMGIIGSTSRSWAWIFIIITTAILLSQIVHTFLTREF